MEKAASYKEASDIVNDRVFNTQLCESIVDARDGKLDKQAAPGELYIRRRIRERSVIRRILDFQTATDADLTTLPSEEKPVIWGTLQGDSHGAVSLSMSDTADQESFWRESWIVRFFVISTPEYYKNEFELKGHPQDTVKNLTEDMLLDLEDQEDSHAWAGVEDIVGAPEDVSPDTGMCQNFWAGEFSRSTYTDVKYVLKTRKLPTGVFVVNEQFMANFEKLDRTEIGGDLSQELFLKGGDALKEGIVGGVTHIFTSKNQFVPNNVLYQFTAQDYLGIAREYQKPTMFMEKKKRTLFLSLEEIIAIGFINVGGILKFNFANKPAEG